MVNIREWAGRRKQKADAWPVMAMIGRCDGWMGLMELDQPAGVWALYAQRLAPPLACCSSWTHNDRLEY